MRLSASLIDEICRRIQAGAFEQVAVESLGIAFTTFEDWLRRGQPRRARGLCRRLFDSVRKARGHARLMAEMQLRQEDAKAWLLHGPGRATPSQDGWAGSAATRPGNQAADESAWREYVLNLCAVLLEALTPFPEARDAAAAAIVAWQAANPLQGRITQEKH
jgi:hypothetical protein